MNERTMHHSSAPMLPVVAPSRNCSFVTNDTNAVRRLPRPSTKRRRRRRRIVLSCRGAAVMLVALQLFVQLPRESECCLLDDDSTRRRCTGQTYLAAVTASHSSTSSGGSNGANSDIVNSRVAFLNPSHRRTHIRRILQRGTAVVNTHTTTPLPLLSRRGCGLLHKRAATSSSTALSMASKTKTGKTGARLGSGRGEDLAA